MLVKAFDTMQRFNEGLQHIKLTREEEIAIIRSKHQAPKPPDKVITEMEEMTQDDNEVETKHDIPILSVIITIKSLNTSSILPVPAVTDCA